MLRVVVSVSSCVQADATTPNIAAPTMLRVVVSVSSCVQADAATPNNTNDMQKSVQTDATCNIQQC